MHKDFWLLLGRKLTRDCLHFCVFSQQRRINNSVLIFVVLVLFFFSPSCLFQMSKQTDLEDGIVLQMRGQICFLTKIMVLRQKLDIFLTGLLEDQNFLNLELFAAWTHSVSSFQRSFHIAFILLSFFFKRYFCWV